MDDPELRGMVKRLLTKIVEIQDHQQRLDEEFSQYRSVMKFMKQEAIKEGWIPPIRSSIYKN